MKTSLYLAFSLAVATGALASAATPSGVYGQVLLAAGPDGAVQGVFANTSGEGVTETCEIFFAGAATQAAIIPVKTWDATKTTNTGTVERGQNAVTLTAQHYADFAGCGMAGDPLLDTGEEFDLTRPTAWTGLDQISAAKAYFHTAPADGKQPRAYVIKGDVVGVLGTSDGWLHVEYVSPNDTTRSVIGWIGGGQAESLTPP